MNLNRDHVVPAIIMGALLVMAITWTAPWVQMESTETASSPGPDMLFMSFPGWQMTFNIEFELSFWWVYFAINGDSETASWFELDADDGPIGAPISNAMMILGLAALALHAALLRTAGSNQQSVGYWSGWVAAVLPMLAMIVWTISIVAGDFSLGDMRAGFWLSWFAVTALCAGMVVHLTSNFLWLDDDAPFEAPAKA